MAFRDPTEAEAAILLDPFLRTDFPSFIAKTFHTVQPGAPFLPNWHIDGLAWRLEQVRLGDIRRLIVTLPPRSLKSIAASVAFPAYILGHDPGARVVCISYANDLAAQHALQFRGVIISPWYRRIFPYTAIGARNSDSEVSTTAKGYRLATSTTGTLTRRGGQTVIIDDSLKPGDAYSDTRREATNEWFSHTLLSRLDDKCTGAIIIVMQRIHMHDLVGHVLEKGGDWHVLNLPAIAEVEERIQIGPDRWKTRRVGELLHPEREPQEALDEIKANLGADLFAAQYQQSPVPPGGATIKRNWIRRYDSPPARGGGYRVVQSWDTAVQAGAANDFSVGVTWAFKTGEYYLIDVVRERLEYPALKRAVLAAAERHRPERVLIESAALGPALLQELRNSGTPLIGITPRAEKETRMEVQAAKFEAGQVYLPRQAPWLPELERELFSFPQARHDDQVDAISQFLEYISQESPIRIRRP